MRLLMLLCLFATTTAAIAESAPLTTHAERTGYRETGRYAEVVQLCGDFARAHADAVRCVQFGRTPEGRPMQALVATRTGALTATDARARKLPVVLVQGGIHAGEIDGKDAGFLALRELLKRDPATSPLRRLVLVFVPVFNVDGHENFGAWNRPNQRGPAQMGWRTTAQNFNLNRDYAKADTPEMRAMLALVEAWDPLVTVDLHATDGAQFEHDISIQVEPLNAGDAALRRIGRTLRDDTIARLAAQGSLPLPFYPSFVSTDDPASGFVDSVAPPRFSTGYFWLRNRLAMLVETHSWKEYPVRVHITRNTIHAVLEQVADEGHAWRRQAIAADARASRLGGRELPIDFSTKPEARRIKFRGYAYARGLSRVSGATMTRYDETKPEIWLVPLRDAVIENRRIRAPRGGYLVPVAFVPSVQPALDAHSIRYRRLDTGLPGVATEVFRATTVRFDAASFEGHHRVELKGNWLAEPQDLAAGSIFVPIDQPKAQLLHALLEPEAPDSLAAWGVFNNRFEQKEYMEAYVAEDVARQMLASDPVLKQAFEKRVAEDKTFAADAQARLDFFARRHSSWDEHFNLYPVFRVDVAPVHEH